MEYSGIKDDVEIRTKIPSILTKLRVMKYIAIVLGLFCIIMLIILVFIAGDKRQYADELIECQKQNDDSTEVCSTPHCVKMAALMIENMNQNVNPCDNFYEYACGGWTKRYVIGDDRADYSSFIRLREQMEIVLKGLYEVESPPTELESIRKVKNFYQSCIDMETIERKGIQPFVDFLVSLGGWPVLGTKPGGNWAEANYNFESLWTKQIQLNFDVIFVGYVFTDAKNSRRRVIYLDQARVGMQREYFLEEKYSKEKEAYLKYMTDVAVLLGADPNVADSHMRAVLDFETKVANFSVPAKLRRDAKVLYNPYTLKSLAEEITQIDIRRMFTTLIPPEITTLPDDEPIINRSPEYVRQVAQLLANTPPEIVANYMIWRFAQTMTTLLGQDFIDAELAFEKVRSGTATSRSRWRVCSDTINTAMKFAIGRMYVEETFTGESKTDTERMIGNLKKAFLELLEQNNWMDKETRKAAAAKSNGMLHNIGYPDWIMDDEKLNEKYADCNYQADDYFGNFITSQEFDSKEAFGKLRLPVDRNEWTSGGPAVVNAYYSSSNNMIMFPAGILQPPFYHAESPDYLNYGGIGMVIGHEITHGFDDRGRQYDQGGNLVQWWSNSSIENFKERAQCIIDQYSEYEMPENGVNIDGVKTQGENIADNGGLKESFLAYQNLLKETGEKVQSLPGVNLNDEQMFFVNFAQAWCSLYRPEAIKSRVLSHVHTFGRYRVIGPIHNNEDFSRVFNCPASSYMNPKKKCVVW